MMRRVNGILLAATSLLLLAGMSQLPWRPPDANSSMLRVSARFRAEIDQRCRRATAEELAAQAAHMRQPVVCEPAIVAPYTLVVRVDDVELHSSTVRGSGRAGEGTLYVLEEFPLQAGSRRVHVTLRREGAPSAPVETDTAGDYADRRPSRHAVPPLSVLDTAISVARGSIILVMWDAERERLITRVGD